MPVFMHVNYYFFFRNKKKTNWQFSQIKKKKKLFCITLKIKFLSYRERDFTITKIYAVRLLNINTRYVNIIIFFSEKKTTKTFLMRLFYCKYYETFITICKATSKSLKFPSNNNIRSIPKRIVNYLIKEKQMFNKIIYKKIFLYNKTERCVTCLLLFTLLLEII